jgi:hypothetical protein
MEIQVGLDIVSGRAGKTAAGQVCKQRMGLWREAFPVLKAAVSLSSWRNVLVMHVYFSAG